LSEAAIGELFKVVVGQRVDVKASCNDNMERTIMSKRWVSKKKEFPPITLPSYAWVKGEVGTFYSQYSDKFEYFAFHQPCEYMHLHR